ncbi:MAG: cytochrome b5-like heme/steroid binding domain-containing protein [Patescibacteria group bacterium]
MKKLFSLLLVAFFSLTLTACTTSKPVSTPVTPIVSSPVVPTSTAKTGYSLADVSLHKTASDCWTIIDGSVYNITAYVTSNQHPGGDNVSGACGIDASRIFANIRKHSSALTAEVLQQYYLGLEIK